MDADARRATFGRWFGNELEARGWNYSVFGRRVDVPRQTVRSWAVGERLPDPGSCYLIAAGLGLHPDEVLNAAKHRPLAADEPGLYEEYRELRAALAHLANVRQLDQERDYRQFRTIYVFGMVAADMVRYTDDSVMEPLSVAAVRLKGARAPFGLLVTGECMRSLGIFAGDVLIVDKDPDRRPEDGELVVVRVGGESTFKRWCAISDNEVELRDGDGTVALRLHPVMDEYEIEGFYITYEPLAPR